MAEQSEEIKQKLEEVRKKKKEPWISFGRPTYDDKDDRNEGVEEAVGYLAGGLGGGVLGALAGAQNRQAAEDERYHREVVMDRAGRQRRDYTRDEAIGLMSSTYHISKDEAVDMINSVKAKYTEEVKPSEEVKKKKEPWISFVTEKDNSLDSDVLVRARFAKDGGKNADYEAEQYCIRAVEISKFQDNLYPEGHELRGEKHTPLKPNKGVEGLYDACTDIDGTGAEKQKGWSQRIDNLLGTEADGFVTLGEAHEANVKQESKRKGLGLVGDFKFVLRNKSPSLNSKSAEPYMTAYRKAGNEVQNEVTKMRNPNGNQGKVSAESER